MRALAAVLGASLVVACGGGGGPQCNNQCQRAGITQCAGSQVQTCVADANGCLAWSAAASCGAQQFCSAATSACVACNNTCSQAGATQCAGTQVQTCTADANGCLAFGAAAACPQGQICQADQKACVLNCASAPNIAAAGSPAGPAADPMACQRPVKQSTLASSRVQSLGTQPVAHAIPFNVPPGTGNFSIVIQAVSAGTNITAILNGNQVTLPNNVFPALIKAPGNNTFFDSSAQPADGTTSNAWYKLLLPSTAVFTVPNSSPTLASWSTGGAPYGTWSVTLDDFAYECAGLGSNCLAGGTTADTYDVSVITGAQGGSAGSVDIAFYLVTSSFTAAAAIHDAGMARMISTLQTIYGRAGLCLGNVTFYDVQQWAKDKYATGVDVSKTEPCDNLDQMFTLSEAGNRLNFFLVDDITQPGGGTGRTVGIDGSIPGPSSIGGTVHSGAVVNASNIGLGTCGNSIDFNRCGSDNTAYITAHEGGHWMGLYHPSERYGNSFDPLSDTGPCVCTSCVSGTRLANCAQNNPQSTPTTVTGSDCNKGGQCDGSQYLMFWLIDDTSVGNFSAQQGQVVRDNPVVQ